MGIDKWYGENNGTTTKQKILSISKTLNMEIKYRIKFLKELSRLPSNYAKTIEENDEVRLLVETYQEERLW